jgi:glycosyltransferase involved in cell wall biosynthesis
MKLLVFTYPFRVCGTTVNAIDLAAALRDFFGHEVVIFAGPGPLSELAEQKRVRLVTAPEAFVQPSLERIKALRHTVRQEKPDLIYAWDWPQSVDAYYGVHLSMKVPIAMTSMSMVIERMLPKVAPTTFGTPELVDRARARGHVKAELLLPPVDINQNSPGAVDGVAFREKWGIKHDEITVVTVSRLDEYMKSESLFRTAETVLTLAPKVPLRFVVVGDGDARPKLEKRAAEINADLGRPTIVFTGEMVDPRPAYDAADIAVCMGGSALRAMAFAKPVVVAGERGFARLLTPETADSFHYYGLYGRGDGCNSNGEMMAAISTLCYRPELREELGRFSREFVVRHFGLPTVSAGLDAFCRDAMAYTPRLPQMAADGIRTAGVYIRERRFLSFLNIATPVKDH